MNDRWTLVAAMASCLVLAVACSEILPTRGPGEQLYRARCSSCHGLDAAGNTPQYMGNAAADLTDSSWEHISDEGGIEYIVQNGIPGACPANADLDRQQIDQLEAYVRELRKKKTTL